MSKRISKRGMALPHPWWIRWVASACLLLSVVVGTAQATHIHGDILPHTRIELHQPAADGQTLGGEEHCPLCVAMYSTLPVLAVVSHASAIAFRVRRVERTFAARETHWHFARFSRPPPRLA